MLKVPLLLIPSLFKAFIKERYDFWPPLSPKDLSAYFFYDTILSDGELALF